MCGICGVFSGTFTNQEAKMFDALMMFNVMRGKDSTGVLRVAKHKRELEIQKSLLPSPVAIFLPNDPVSKLMRKPETGFMIGHCRAATKGEVKLENAHPFEFEHVAGVHNGTIHKKFRGTEKYGTDSEALYALINEVGIEDALNEVQDAYNKPAYALAWYDKRDGLVRFIHNGERPMSFGFSYSGTTLSFSSDINHLKTAAKFAGVTLSSEDMLKEKSETFGLHKHHLFTVDPRNTKKYEITEVKVKEPVRPIYSHSSRVGAWEGWKNEDLGGNTGGTNLTRKERKEQKKQRRLAAQHFYAKGFHGQKLVFSELREIFESGCAMCSKQPILNPLMADAVTWIDDDSFICVDCSNKNQSLLQDWENSVRREADFDVDGSVIVN